MPASTETSVSALVCKLICIVREDLTVDILIVSFYAIPSCHTGGAIYKCAVKISAQHNVFVIGSF